jgi:hypothetical protein
MFRPFGAFFRGSTIKVTCFTIAMDLSIISYIVAMTKQVKISDGKVSIGRYNKEQETFLPAIFKHKYF